MRRERNRGQQSWRRTIVALGAIVLLAALLSCSISVRAQQPSQSGVASDQTPPAAKPQGETHITPEQGKELFRSVDELIKFAFDKYFEKGALLGTPDSCVKVVDRFKGMGVDEIACLIDFGVDEDLVVRSLSHLNELRRRYA